jgi:hypothetical protein
MAEVGLTKQRIIAELTKSPHGKLEAYVPVGRQAVDSDPEFFAHLIAWAAVKSEIRDVKVALPVLALAHNDNREFSENALAHLADLAPRDLLRALDFARLLKHHPRYLRRFVERYLRDLEADRHGFDRTALQHRQTVKRLYALYHVAPGAHAAACLFGEAPKGSVFDVVKRLDAMSPSEAAGAIIGRKIPFLIAAGALKAKLKEPDVVMALIKAMSPTELVTNMKFLEKLGVKTDPALRAALDEALAKAATSRKPKASMKASTAAAAQTDEKLQAQLHKLQEQQLDQMVIKGKWLVLGDKSGSMQEAIAMSIEIAAMLARTAEQVSLVFFDSGPRYIEATGKTLLELKIACRHITAHGNTSIGCGVQYALERGLDVDGIAIISDGGENTVPIFAPAYQQLTKKLDKIIPVYLYLMSGSCANVLTKNCALVGIDVQEFDLRGGVDKYSLPNLAKTMRANRYSLVDEIMATELKVLDGVLKQTKGQEVLRGSVDTVEAARS